MRWDEHVARIPCVYHERDCSKVGCSTGDTHLHIVKQVCTYIDGRFTEHAIVYINCQWASVYNH
jgi:hypothetical protein